MIKGQISAFLLRETLPELKNFQLRGFLIFQPEIFFFVNYIVVKVVSGSVWFLRRCEGLGSQDVTSQSYIQEGDV